MDVGNPAVRASALLVFFAIAAWGCDQSSPSWVERLSRLSAQGEDMERAIEDLEERLLGNQARVHLWQEMARRHQRVSAVACENLSGHALEIAKRMDLQQVKRRARRGKHSARPEVMTAAPATTPARARNN
ncbi:MAG TPA: hypothetical protein VE549_13090 [Myxococcaceae bacterium]|nr:hypothetical protein [Myxococcaceae bacterium]